MTNGEFFLVVGTIVILTVGVFWSHFNAELARIDRENKKK
jgi:hypothetical protein